MRGFLAVMLMSFRTFLRSRESVFWGVVFPLLLMGLIGLAFGNGDSLQFRVSVVDQGSGELGAALTSSIRYISAFKVVVEGEEDALKALKKGDRTLVVVLPKRLASTAMPTSGTTAAAASLSATSSLPATPVAITTYYDAGRAQTSQAGLTIIEKVIADFNKQASGRPDLMQMSTQGISPRRLSGFDYLLPGILAMTLMQTGLMGVTHVISNYRERLVLKRVLATSIHPFAFLSGLIARFTIMNLIQALIIFLVATVAFKAKTVGSLLDLAFLATLGSITFLGVGFAVSTLSKTAEAASTLGSLINFPMMFLSGTFWPREAMPDWIQPFVRVLPLSPLVDAMRGISTQGSSVIDYTSGILYMLGWGALAFLIAARKFRWE